MKILAIHRYFWPDTPPYASMLRAIGENWVRKENQVTIFSSQPSYKPEAKIPQQPSQQVVNGILIKRMNLPPEKKMKGAKRIFNIFHFSLGVFFYVLKKAPFDFVMASTAPPVFVGFFSCIAAKIKGSKFIYHVMDIQPEIGRISGEFSNCFVYNLLMWIDTLTCKMASTVVVLSEDMAEAIKSRKGGSDVNVQIINNFSLPSYDDTDIKLKAKFLKKKNTLRVIFAGNIGRFQGLETIINTMFLLSKKNKHIELVFLGDGTDKNLLKTMSDKLLNVSIHFIDHQPISIAKQIIRDADIGLVSLKADVQKYAYPSKVMTYLSEGCPVLVLVAGKCELTEFVIKNEIGVCATRFNEMEIAKILLNLYDDPDKCSRMCDNAKKISKQFDENIVVEKWGDLIS